MRRVHATLFDQLQVRTRIHMRPHHNTQLMALQRGASSPTRRRLQDSTNKHALSPQ
jgi:hypothetical protein